MKYMITTMILLLTNLIFAQSNFPHFLQGTWKMENKENYELWSSLNENTLKGFAYRLKDGQMIVSEYMDISLKGGEVTFTATVINQNQGKGIDFKLTKSDSIFTFENHDHDFPNKIAYHQLSDTEIFVQVSDNGQKGFSYKMIKIGDNNVEKGK